MKYHTHAHCTSGQSKMFSETILFITVGPGEAKGPAVRAVPGRSTPVTEGPFSHRQAPGLLPHSLNLSALPEKHFLQAAKC